MLALTEKVAGAPEAQVLLGDLKAVVGFGHHLQPLACLLVLVVAHEDAVALGGAAAHAAPQLVQLAQAEALRIFHHHGVGVGHVHAHLDDGGGHQNIALAGGEGRHDGFLVLGLHLAVEHGDAQVGEDVFLQLLGVGGDGLALIGDLLSIAHQRADDEDLMALVHLLADEGIDALAVILAHGEGIHLLPSGGQLVDDGHIQIAVDDEGQRAGDRGGGEHQHMGVFRLLAQRGPLSHAEAVLLIGDDKAQTGVLHILRQQGVGADAQVDGTALQVGKDGAALLGTGRTCQQGAGEPQTGEQGGQGLVVLAGQNLRRGHQGALPAILSGEPHAGGSHHGLAAAHISLTQAVHGPLGAHIAHSIVDGALLGTGEGEGQLFVEGGQVNGMAGGAGHVLSGGAQQMEAAGQEEQLLEHHAAAGDLQRLGGGGEVDIFVGVAGVAQVVLLPHPIGQHILQQLAAGIQTLPHGAGEDQLADTGGEGVEGHDATGDLLLALFLDEGVDHLAAQEVALHLTVKDVGFSLVEGVFTVFLIEKDQIKAAAFVHGAALDQCASAADAVGSGVGSYHGLDAGVLAQDQLPNGAGQGAVLVATGEVGDEVLQRGDAQLVQRLGALLANAFDIADVGLQISHDHTSLVEIFLYCSSFLAKIQSKEKRRPESRLLVGQKPLKGEKPSTGAKASGAAGAVRKSSSSSAATGT